jgi:tetratricopeptide (TPR) repeat protein
VIWFHHMYSQIRRYSSRGNDSASSFANAANVPSTDVLVRTRRGGGWKYRGGYSSSLVPILALLIFSITGCKDKRASLEKQYAEARLLFQQGYVDQPLPLAESGYKDSAKYPDLNWKFRVLAADARNRKGRFAAALEILEPEPPSNIPSEIFWHRRLTQASSLCQSGKYPQAEDRFAQAAALHAELGALSYARGRCAM